MVQAVHDTGLGSIEQIYLSVIPPLSAERNLPEVSAIFDLALQRAKRHEQLQHWRDAGDVFLWLFRSMKKFPLDRNIVARATAILLAYLMTVSEMRETQQKDSSTRNLEMLELDLRKDFETAEDWIRSSLKSLYEECDFQQDWETRQARRRGRGGPAVQQRAEYRITFNVTHVHIVAQTGVRDNLYRGSTYEGLVKDANSRDVLERTPLHYTVTEDKGVLTEEILIQTDVNARDLFERTPLHYACRQDQRSPAEELLKQGAALNIQARDGATPLHYAASRGHERLVEFLIEAGAVLDILDLSGRSPLHLAACNGQEAAVRQLWQVANRDLRDHHGRTALHLAVEASQIGVVQLLLDSNPKADTEAKDRQGQTPVWLAIQLDQSEASEAIVKQLFSHGADIESKNRVIGKTPLIWVAEKGRESLVQCLLECGANANAETVIRHFPLHGAVDADNVRIIKQLLDKGAAVEGSGLPDDTPLRHAARRGRIAAVLCLLDNGAKIAVDDENGSLRTEALQAANSGRVDHVHALIDVRNSAAVRFLCA